MTEPIKPDTNINCEKCDCEHCKGCVNCNNCYGLEDMSNKFNSVKIGDKYYVYSFDETKVKKYLEDHIMF